MAIRRRLVGTAALALTGALIASAASAETVFVSTQLRPIEEAQKVREQVLANYPGELEFVPEEGGPMLTRIKAEAEAGKGSVDVLGALHGELPPLAAVGALQPVGDIMAGLGDRKMIPAFVELGKLGTDEQMYVPWMQATYIMAANKKALEFLPGGVDLDSLTYADLTAWGKAMTDATGERKIGFPAGPKGLMHRFLQGYLYPSYTGGVVRSFKSADAEAMWGDFRAMWEFVTPRSTSYAFMQEPLLAEEVWVAFDHTARLLDAFNQKPDEFVAFAAPSGARGKGFMPVVAGLAVPKFSPDPKGAAEVIAYMTSPEVQLATLKAVGFYPVIQMDLPEDLPAGTRIAAGAITAQASAADALPSLLPVGLGDKGGEFSKTYSDTFQLIVLRGNDIRETLDSQGAKLAAIMNETGAPCWAPDADSDGACPVE